MAAFFTSDGWGLVPATLRLDGLPETCSSGAGERDAQADKKGALWLPWFCLAIKSELIASSNTHVTRLTVNDRTVDIGIVGFIKQVVDIAL